MMKTAKRLLGGLMVLALGAGGASASLIGDTVDTRWQYSAFDRSESYVVVGGAIEDDEWIQGSAGAYNIDIEASSVEIIADGAVAQASSTIWTFSDLDWIGSPASILGVSAITSWNGWSDSFLSFTADSVTVTLGNSVNFSNGQSLLINLDFGQGQDPVIPEPATMTLLGLGLAGTALARRRRERRSA